MHLIPTKLCPKSSFGYVKTLFLEAPPKLQLALSAQTEIILPPVFTLLTHFVK
jgi:hypothetical protein